jgi:hypothetical protein
MWAKYFAATVPHASVSYVLRSKLRLEGSLDCYVMRVWLDLVLLDLREVA